MLRADPQFRAELISPPPPQSRAPEPSSRAQRIAAGFIVFSLAWIGCALARLVSGGDPSALLIWPASGVALAAGIVLGPMWTLPAAAGVLAWAASVQLDVSMGLLMAGLTIAGPAACVHVLRSVEQWRPVEQRLDLSLRFSIAVLAVSAPVGALLLLLAPLLWPGADAQVWRHAASWWLVDALGQLLVAPVAITLLWRLPVVQRTRRGTPILRLPTGPLARLPIDAAATLLVAVVLGVAIALADVGHSLYAEALLFLYFPIVAWTALRRDGAVTAWTLLVTGAALLATRALTAQTDPLLPALDAPVLLLCAVLVATILQAVAEDRRLALERMARLAREDMSTQLLNDRGLVEQLSDRLADRGRPDYGLIGLQITNFNTLHDLCGALEATHLEQRVATLLRNQANLSAAARLSSGRFALLVQADSLNALRATARELYSALHGQVLRTAHGSVRQQVCVAGLLVDRAAAVDQEDCLVSLADALSIAASVRDLQLFVEPLSQTMIDARRSHQARSEQIREAISEQRFSLHAQPVNDPSAPAGRLSYEILLRLRERDGTLIRPPEFMDLAIQAQLTPAMDRGVVRAVFSWLASHPEALQRTWRCAINLSGASVGDGTMTGFIREQRARHNIPAERIVFEIAEGEAIRNPGITARMIDELKTEGFGVAMDDFGSGLATFEYLRRFPLDYLKIDGAFIRNLTTSVIDEEIVMSTVRVARRLNLRTVAEHVHTEAIRSKLETLGVDRLQGEIIGEPRPLNELFDTEDTALAEAAAV